MKREWHVVIRPVSNAWYWSVERQTKLSKKTFRRPVDSGTRSTKKEARNAINVAIVSDKEFCRRCDEARAWAERYINE